MNAVNCILILIVAFIAVFLQSTVDLFRNLLGAQFDLLPALMVYASLTSGMSGVVLLSVFGGLWMDSLSINPLGVSVLPLFIIGFAIFGAREYLLRDNPFAQMLPGLSASALAPGMTVFLLLNLGCAPLLGWAWIWKWLVMTVAGGLLTPVSFRAFDLFHKTFSYQPWTQTSFRPDREIKRGRF